MNSIFSKTWLSAVIGGVAVLIIYFTADSCGPDPCPEGEECKSVNGFKYECAVKSFDCEGNACCENSPNPLCCLNGVCSNENFVFNGTNSDQCQCECNDGFTGKPYDFYRIQKSMVIKELTVT